MKKLRERKGMFLKSKSLYVVTAVMETLEVVDLVVDTRGA